jgi:hypothetical protein
MDVINEANEMTLGKKLRKIVEQARSTAEIEKLTEVLEDVARKGESKVKFKDLREYTPTLILNGTIWDWFRDNELVVTGTVDQNTGAYEYLVSWE